MIISLQEFQTSHRESFEKNFREMQKDYTDFLSTLYTPPGNLKDKLLFGCNPILTNNPYQCEFYEDFCQLHTLFEYIIGNLNVTAVEVGTFQQQQILSQIIIAREPKRKIQVLCKKSKIKFWFSEVFKEFKGLVLFFYTWFLFWAYASQKRKNNIDRTKEYIVVDTYVLKSQLISGKFHNRYFTDNILSEIRVEKNGSEILFFPEITHDFFAKANFETLEASGNRFLFKHDFFLSRDFLSILKLSFSRRPTIANPVFKGVDLAKPIKVASSRLRFKYLLNTINYYVVERIQTSGINISCFIDWWENQMIDKITNLGMAKFYPHVQVYGFMNYLVDLNYNFNILPTKFQRDLSFTPTNYITSSNYMGNKLSDFGLTFNPKVIKNNRFNLIDNSTEGKGNILVILPILQDDSNFILNMLKQYLDLVEKNLKVTVKLHPADDNQSNYQKLFSCKQIEFTNLTLDKLYSTANLVISSTSSACVEALINRIPLIILSGSRYIQDPVPFIRDNMMYRKVDKIHEFELAISHFLSRDFVFDGRIALELKEMFISDNS